MKFNLTCNILFDYIVITRKAIPNYLLIEIEQYVQKNKISVV